ncbi:MHYT domain-containing protein (plasmid) [Streptomyces sp. HUAS 31]|uniref:MHYT domain-containing protein n=1 Tax=Streptomyces sp. HUAS 31 TaxID=3020055 RepID=UPI002306C13B|nr:MHYT domain-containing protein [Streptomyces sp. HUAS 31]WCE02445.1 MHYT domain-containing protein [Streptomyces sp. HUAS 31]
MVAFLMAWLGSSLGLRCMVRTLHRPRGWKPGWLALGGASIGCGIWTMHFVAMTGFTITNTRVAYDTSLTLLSLLIAVVVAAMGVFVVGYAGSGALALCLAGPVVGLGVAGMHVVGMAAMRTSGGFRFDTAAVVLSLAIAVGTATAALWTAVGRASWAPLLGGLVLAVAVCGMHYTAMAALSYDTLGHTDPTHGNSPLSPLLPMLTGPVFFLLFAAFVVMLDPLVVGGADAPEDPRAFAPATGQHLPPRPDLAVPAPADPPVDSLTGVGHRDRR